MAKKAVKGRANNSDDSNDHAEEDSSEDVDDKHNLDECVSNDSEASSSHTRGNSKYGNRRRRANRLTNPFVHFTRH